METEISHDAVHNVWLWREEVYRIDIAIRWPPLIYLLDVYNDQQKKLISTEERTCDIFIQYLVFLDDIIKETSRVFVNYQDFPLCQT